MSVTGVIVVYASKTVRLKQSIAVLRTVASYIYRYPVTILVA